jgi:ariadne-1
MSANDEEPFVDATSSEMYDDYYLGSQQGSVMMLEENSSDGVLQARTDSSYGAQAQSGNNNTTGGASTLTIDDALQRMRCDAENIKELAFTSQTVALILLKYFQWSIVRARDRFFDARDEIFKQLNITDDTATEEPTIQRNTIPVTCCICWDDVEPDQAVSLASCSHWVCHSCGHEACTFAIQRGTNVIDKRCPGPKCSCFSGEALFRAVLSKPDDIQRYNRALIREYLVNNATMRWCCNPKGNCDHIIRVQSNRDRVHEVQCSACSTRFCFNCGDDAHAPATCDMLVKWRKKAADDSETANWVAANTKNCPKCQRTIEKNGGCNHMVCAGCKYDWCWVCEGDWQKHGSSWYACNFFDPKADKNKNSQRDSAKESLQRYIFYFSRYLNHLNSQKLDSKVMQQVQLRMQETINKGDCTDPYRYLTDTANVLFECRHTLMYTYVYSFYLEENAEKTLFEYQQAQLELATEELSMVIEGSKVMDAQAVMDKSAIAKKFHTEIAKGVWVSS